MFIYITYDAKIGEDRQIRTVGVSPASNGEIHIQFDKDIDWNEPVFMMLVPTEVKNEQ